MAFSVFISHSVSPVELGIVYGIADEAARRGMEPYIPDRDWNPAEQLPDRIFSALHNIDVCVVVATQFGTQLDWVNAEIAGALVKPTPFIAMLDSTLPPQDPQIEGVRVMISRDDLPGTLGRALQKIEKVHLQSPHQATIEITGQVLKADIRQRRFQLWVNDKTAVTATLTEAQEELVTSVLKDHRSMRVTIRGRADVSPQGRPIRFIEVEALIMLPAEDVFDSSARPIEDELTEIASRVPEEQWKKLPADLTDQLDHYLYGTPKR